MSHARVSGALPTKWAENSPLPAVDDQALPTQGKLKMVVRDTSYTSEYAMRGGRRGRASRTIEVFQTLPTQAVKRDGECLIERAYCRHRRNLGWNSYIDDLFNEGTVAMWARETVVRSIGGRGLG